MRPKTKIQKEVAGLSKRLPQLSKTQREYAFENCMKHYAYMNKSKTSCLECGHRWKAKYNNGEQCICPQCGKRLTVHETMNRVYKQTDYFCVLTTKDKYQVIRYYELRIRCKIGQQAEYSINEVVQRWIAPDGKNVIIARLRSMSYMYCDLWNLSSNMAIRRENQYDVYNISPYMVYPRMKIIPRLKRNGFCGEFHGITPFDLFDAILKDNKKETLLKAGQTGLLKHSIYRSINFDRYWPSIKICIRNNYEVEDASMWIDYIDLLKQTGKDARNPKYVCPCDLKTEHDKLMKKRNEILAREALERHKVEIAENEKKYFESKNRFFGLVFTDGTIQVKTLQSVQDFAKEGEIMHHCVFANRYYLKDDSLIMSATIDGERIETIEISLKTLKVVQSRGLCNQNTEYHDRIIDLVNKNMNQISKRIAV